MIDSLAPALAGFGLGASLIIAIGAQNVFVLRQGLRREHVGAVVAVCAVSDVVLIAAGVVGLGVLVERWPAAAEVARLAGAAFLLGYAALAAYRAWRPRAEAAALDLDHARRPGNGDRETEDVGAPGTDALPALADDPAPGTPRTAGAAGAAGAAGRGTAALQSALVTALALTWLNPHVYLDTVFLLGSVASGYGPDARWVFGLGAMVASLVWFSTLGFGSRLLARFFESPRAWRVLDGIVALVMLAIAVSLLLG